ncbi:MAG: NADH-quinone oxidoreductase subunit NuoE [Capsulimonadaceae bacterium]|nr:NADH-quinone oxidoreductase subunit NuoE [Capsulimonadaceae bacterium]
MFTVEAKEQLDNIVKKYPTKRAALLPALWLAQEQYDGWLPPEALREVAGYLEMPPAEVEGVATFYTMYNKEKIGKFHIEVCHNIACMVRGADALIDQIGEKLGIGKGETTPDGKFTLSGAECLGACANAPCMMIGAKYFEDLTPEKVDAIVEEYKKK